MADKSRKNINLIDYYPVIDGHFWVVKDSKVIDYLDDDMMSMIKKFNGCHGDKIYLQAPPLVQKVMLKAFDVIPRDKLVLILKQSKYKPMDDLCYFNAIYNQDKYGGEIVFGSFGWEKEAGGIHYEYGGDGWKVSQFIKQKALLKM